MSQPDGFADFWSVYPRRVGKVDAKRAFAKAIERVPLVTILAGAQRYAAEKAGTDSTYTLHPVRWLDGEHWDDEPARAAVKRRAW